MYSNWLLVRKYAYKYAYAASIMIVMATY